MEYRRRVLGKILQHFCLPTYPHLFPFSLSTWALSTKSAGIQKCFEGVRAYLSWKFLGNRGVVVFLPRSKSLQQAKDSYPVEFTLCLPVGVYKPVVVLKSTCTASDVLRPTTSIADRRQLLAELHVSGAGSLKNQRTRATWNTTHPGSNHKDPILKTMQCQHISRI